MNFMNRRSRVVTAMLLALILVLSAGCQAVGNVDLNKMLTSGLEVQSYEGRAEIALDLTLDEASATAEEKESLPTLRALNGLKLILEDIRQENRTTSSMKGSLILSGGTIPIHLSTDNQGRITIMAEGARRALVLEQSANVGDAELMLPARQLGALTQSMNAETQVELVRMLTAYIIPKLPNPKSLSVEPTTVTVMNEPLALTRIHTEIGGGELPALEQELIKNLLDDEQGLLQLVGGLIDLTAASPGAPQGFADHKEVSVLLISNVIRGMLQQAYADLQKGESPLDSRSRFSLDIYTDSQQVARKSEAIFSIVPNLKSKSAVQAVKLTVKKEIGKINQPVQADVLQPGQDELVLGAAIRSYDVLNAFEPSSAAYRFLKDGLRITRKHVKLPLEDGGKPDREGVIKPYLEGAGVTMVPARFVTERLEADVEWDGAARQVQIHDPFNGTVVVLTIDDRTATVNGKSVTLEEAPEIVHGSTYVPVRFIAEAFGASVDWDGTTRTVSIIREP